MSEALKDRPKELCRSERGFALVMVLWILVLLTLLVVDFAFSTRLETTVVRNYLEEAQSYYLVQAAFHTALAEILEGYDYTYLQPEDNQLVFARRNPTDEEPNEAPYRTDLVFGAGFFSYDITDEESKININVTTRPRLMTLLEQTGVEDVIQRSIIADSVLDWIDPDPLHKLNGAEDDFYEDEGLNYEAKDGRIDTIEELLLVRGVTPTIFYGGVSQDGSETYTGLVDFLTTTGARLNNNTASETVLRTLYSKERADSIFDKREAKEGVYSENQSSSNFTIVASGRVPGSPVRRSIKAIVSGGGGNKTITIKYWNDNYIGR